MNDMSRIVDETLATARVVQSGIDTVLADNDKLWEALELARCYVVAMVEKDSSGETAADLALINVALGREPGDRDFDPN